MVKNDKAQTPTRDVLLNDLEERGWSCQFIRIDTGSESIFALEAHRDGIDYVIISDRLLPALVELYNSLLSPVTGPD